MTIQILIFIFLMGELLLDKNNWSLLLHHLILGTCVLVLSVTNYIPYTNTEMDKSMIFVFTSRIHIPYHLRNISFLL